MSEVVKMTRPGQRMTCSICHRASDKIYLSSCFHSYCPDCLQSQVSTSTGGQYRCPICRTAVNVSEMNNRDYRVRENISTAGDIQTVRTADDGQTLVQNYVIDSSGNVIHSDNNVSGAKSRQSSVRNYVFDPSGNLVPVSDVSTSSNRSYMEPTTSYNNLEFSRTYIAGSPNNTRGQNLTLNQRESPSGINQIRTRGSGTVVNYGGGTGVTRTRISALPASNEVPTSRTFVRDGGSSAEAKTCDICQDGRKASSLCLKCEQYFCQTCSTAHLKMKASRFHEQQPLSGQIQGPSQQSSLLSSLQSTLELCARHGNEITMLCKRCDMMICNVCKSLEHKDHMTRLVSEEATEVRKNLTIMLQRQITLSERLKAQLIEAEKRKALYPEDLDRELCKLNHQIEEMQLELEREREKAAEELMTHYREHSDRNTELLQDTERNYNALMEVKAEALEMLNSNDDVYVASKGSQLQKKLDQIERECRRADMPTSGPSLQFFQGDIDPGRIRNMVGGVTYGTQQYKSFHRHNSTATLPSASSTPRNDSSNSNTGISSSAKFSLPFTDGVGYVYGIAPVDVNKAWISLLGHTAVALVTRNGNIINSISVGDITEDVAHDGAGGCFVTCPGSKCIKHVGSDGSITTVVEDLRQDPHGITVSQYFDRTKNAFVQELYVCFTESLGTKTSLYEKPKGSVHVLDTRGADLGRGFLMQSPMRIDTNTDSSLLCISDHSNGCVTICDKTGQNIQALYTGTGSDGFKPLGVGFDDSGRVVIADWRAEQVIRISPDGSHTEIIVQEVRGPQSVALKSGYLWVGGKHGTVHVFQMDNYVLP